MLTIQCESTCHWQFILAMGSALSVLCDIVHRGFRSHQAGEQCRVEVSELLQLWQRVAHARVHVHRVRL